MTKKKKEEHEKLVQTQVLNIDEVRKVAKYEKRISKKPALICSLIGAVLILIGGGSQAFINYNSRLNSNKQDDVVERKVEENKEIIAGNSSLSCMLSMQGNANGTNYVSTFTYNFIDSKLKTIKKDIILDAMPEVPLGYTSMTNLYSAYQNYSTITGSINGYSIVTGPRGTIGFFAIADIDLQVLNKAQIPTEYNNNPQISADFDLNTYYGDVKEKIESDGYTCSLILPVQAQTN